MARCSLSVIAFTLASITMHASAANGGPSVITKLSAGDHQTGFCIYAPTSHQWVTDAWVQANTGTCSGGGSYYYMACTSTTDGATTSNNEVKLSIALAAMMAGKTVQIESSGCCGAGVPCISEIAITP